MHIPTDLSQQKPRAFETSIKTCLNNEIFLVTILLIQQLHITIKIQTS